MKLIDCLSYVEETRSHINQDYPVLEISFLTVSALICGHRGWTGIRDFGEDNLEWLRQYLPFAHGIPSRHNIARIVRAIVPHSLTNALMAWAQHYQQEKEKIYAIDGKEVRGVARYGAHPLNVVTAFDIEQGLVLCQHAGPGKGTEIDMVRSMLEHLDINGAILTLDALHCQVETLAQIKKRRGTAVVQVKQNQPKLLEAVDNAFQAYWAQPEAEQQSLCITNKGHGRQEESAYSHEEDHPIPLMAIAQSVPL